MHDVLILGGGAAGITCARRLKEAGLSFQLLEARPRLGGRIFSAQDRRSPVPVELGAEFVHGAPPVLLETLRRHHLPFYDVKDEHLVFSDGRLHEEKQFWECLDAVMNKLKKHGRDRSVEEFLEETKIDDPQIKPLFRAFVEGFHAADLKRIGEAGLKDATETDDESLNGARMFRPLVKYGSVIERLQESFASDGAIRLRTVADGIRWKTGAVEVSARQGPLLESAVFQAKRLVVSLPLGVLQSGAIRWDPMPASLPGILAALHMGHVQRIVLRFRKAFWEQLLKDHPVGFLHAGPDRYFPTWWTLAPLRTPHLVAWQGGPKAEEMASLTEPERVARALETLSELMGKPVADLNSEVEAWHTHNWSRDPFSRGAYSYVGVGGLEAAKRFAEPVDGTIFFAGEATHAGSSRGTVHGAMETGERAADQVLKSLK